MVSKKTAALALASIIIAATAYIYFSVISPLSEKPQINRPELAPGEKVSEKHINWVVNELGGYKLQPSAQIEMIVEGEKFTVATKGGKVVSSEGAANDPDIRIRADRGSFARILSSENTNTEIVALYNEGLISVDLLKDHASLALKGYKGLYDVILPKQ